MEKKGAEMTIGTIVMIILALVVLVVIIYGFTTGWGNLWQNIIGFGGGKVNVQTVVRSCQLACSTSAKFDYCCKERKVVFSEEKTENDMTCSKLQDENVGLESCELDCSDVTCVTTSGDTDSGDETD